MADSLACTPASAMTGKSPGEVRLSDRSVLDIDKSYLRDLSVLVLSQENCSLATHVQLFDWLLLT